MTALVAEGRRYRPPWPAIEARPEHRELRPIKTALMHEPPDVPIRRSTCRAAPNPFRTWNGFAECLKMLRRRLCSGSVHRDSSLNEHPPGEPICRLGLLPAIGSAAPVAQDALDGDVPFSEHVRTRLHFACSAVTYLP
jgi:hypothetical protein